METPQAILTEIIPAEPQILCPSSKSEPDPFVLSDLDDLLSESMAAAKKPTNRRIYKEAKVAVDGMLEAYKQIAWTVEESIEVWQMTKCKCGGLGTMTFVRNMQKLKKVGGTVLHWETVKELPAGVDRKYALTTREVEKCEYCAELYYEKFQDFQEVVK
jgi:hypothetical protein